jgi:hypothetical protein
MHKIQKVREVVCLQLTKKPSLKPTGISLFLAEQSLTYLFLLISHLVKVSYFKCPERS